MQTAKIPIMHVDPKLACAKLMQLLPGFNHYQIKHVSNAEQAIELLLLLKPDLIFTEVLTGSMMGINL